MGTTGVGTNALVYLGLANGEASPVDETFNATVSVTTDTAEDTAHGDFWRTFIPTLSNWEATVEKHTDFGLGGGQMQQWAITRAVLKYYIYPDRDHMTVYWYGTARLGGGGQTMGLEDVVNESYTLIPVSQPSYNHP